MFVLVSCNMNNEKLKDILYDLYPDNINTNYASSLGSISTWRGGEEYGEVTRDLQWIQKEVSVFLESNSILAMGFGFRRQTKGETRRALRRDPLG